MAALVDAVAWIVTTPAAPATHWKVAVPLPVATRVAIVGSADQLPEYGTAKVTGEGDGALLKVPVATNCTWPLELCASAVAGVTAIDCSTRLEFEPDIPHPSVWKIRIVMKETINRLRFGMDFSLKLNGYNF
jgi:hypothetical protein